MTDKKPKIKYKKRRISPEIRAAKHERWKAKYARYKAELDKKERDEKRAEEWELLKTEADLRLSYSADDIYRLAAEQRLDLNSLYEQKGQIELLEQRLENLEVKVYDEDLEVFKISGDGSLIFLDDDFIQVEDTICRVAQLISVSANQGKITHSKWKAQQGAKARLNNDPRQKEKEFIKDCWIDWQADKSKYKSKAAFSRDMLKKVENLTSQKKIEDWCREWEKEYTT